MKEPKMPKSVRIEEAENGYTVSIYSGDSNKKMIAKDMKEAQKIMMEMMGGTKEKKMSKEETAKHEAERKTKLSKKADMMMK